MCVVELSNEPWGSLSLHVSSSGPFSVVYNREEKAVASSTLGESADVSGRLASPGRTSCSRLGLIRLSIQTSHP